MPSDTDDVISLLEGAVDERRSRPAHAACTASRARWPASTRGGRPARSSRCTTWPGWSSRSPTCERAELFARAFGFTTALRTPDELQLRGSDPGSPCVLIRKGPRSRFLGVAFRAADSADVLRLAEATGRTVAQAAGEPGRGDGRPGRPERACGCGWSSDTHELAALPAQAPLTFNVGHDAGADERHPAAAARAGHGAAARARGAADHDVPADARLVSAAPRPDRQRLPLLPRAARARAGDELHPLRPRRARPPTTTRSRWRSARPTATCTPPTRSPTSTRWPPAGSTCASRATSGRGGSAGTSRAARSSTTGATRTGSWSSTSADGDLFDSTLEPGWAPMTASGLAQWGPPATKDFLGIKPGRRVAARAARHRPRAARGQRVRPAPPARPAEGGHVMSISVLRTADAWWVQTPTGAARIAHRGDRPPPNCWPTGRRSPRPPPAPTPCPVEQPRPASRRSPRPAGSSRR